MSELKDLVSTLGFPIFVAVWMMVRDAKMLDSLTRTLSELTNAVKGMKEALSSMEARLERAERG